MTWENEDVNWVPNSKINKPKETNKNSGTQQIKSLGI